MIDFAATPQDTKTIHDITRRAAKLLGVDPVAVAMDVSACHLNGCPLRLPELLAADNGNFAHDIGGIARHLDRETGELQDDFLPRFAAI